MRPTEKQSLIAKKETVSKIPFLTQSRSTFKQKDRLFQTHSIKPQPLTWNERQPTDTETQDLGGKVDYHYYYY